MLPERGVNGTGWATGMKRKAREISRSATLGDIAAAAGVSIGTVSKALNDKVGVGPANRERIMRAMEEVGYRKSETRNRSQATLTSATILTYDRYVANDSFYGEILRGITEEAERRGLTLSVEMLFHGEPAVDPGRLFRRAAPESVIMLGIDQPAAVDAVTALGCPAIIINGMDPRMRIDSVSPDYHFGGWSAARHLIGLGHRRLLHVTHPFRESLTLRLEGYRKALERSGIPFDEKRHVLDTGDAGLTSAGAERAVAALLDEGGFDATALFCVSDMLAIGAMRAVLARGLRVPEDVSIVGFDDLPVSVHCEVPLTTFHIERAEMGRSAVRMLLDGAPRGERGGRRLSIGVQLIERGSAAPPAVS